MKKIKLAFVDFWPTFNPETFYFTQLIRKHFEVEIDNSTPDFVFCSNSSKSFLKYKCPRIYYTGEAVTPDFNLYDYAIGFDNITFGDRYIRYPLCLMDKSMLDKALHKHEKADISLDKKQSFCSYVVSADGGVGNFRDNLFDEICRYKLVSSGGRHRNNLPDGKPVKDKLAFQENFKFCLTCENSSFKGYTTEKIVDAFAARSIPIYWGDPDIGMYFNKNAYINVLDYPDTKSLLDRIIELDSNSEKYLDMLSSPILLPNSELVPMLNDDYLESFFISIFSQDVSKAYRRNSAYSRNGKFHEHDLIRLEKFDNNKAIKTLKSIKRQICGCKKL